MHYIHLGLAIISEVIATSTLKSTEEFTRLWPSVIVMVGYTSAFYFLTLSLRSISVGIAYAIWCGLGIVLVAIAGTILYGQKPDLPAMTGMAMIIAGVAVIHLFSKTAVHS
ncbi:MAG: QacE family quaternary ammonium compound efflux SMR transporter [Deltaproteobacteria bacterium]|nr:QacE family quaternary ammonium compound efflux SMR transporter [Deltaproteobacteria bacterium]